MEAEGSKYLIGIVLGLLSILGIVFGAGKAWGGIKAAVMRDVNKRLYRDNGGLIYVDTDTYNKGNKALKDEVEDLETRLATDEEKYMTKDRHALVCSANTAQVKEAIQDKIDDLKKEIKKDVQDSEKRMMKTQENFHRELIDLIKKNGNGSH